LADGYRILVDDFAAYQDRLGLARSSADGSRDEQPHSSSLTLADKFPLSMLLCLLADGRQLTLDEIDRVLVYLLEKKATMLTLPSGTLPPLPVHYATKNGTSHLSTGRPCRSSDRPRSSSRV
jgi:hypothetical protein